MQMRLHPAESRVRKLSAEIPARFVAFDILLWKGEPLHKLPLEKRRKELERKAKRFTISPYTADKKDAERWLDRLEAAGLDGVVAKRKDLPYLPGSREGVVKVKKYKTADCVIVGFRWSEKADGRISTLLLGLHGKNGEIDFVGHTSGFPAAVRRELEEVLPKMQAPGKISDARIPGGQSRWSKGKELDWNPVRPELVCEVRYDKLEKNRFRHGTRFLRFRPDKDPEQCTWREVRPPRRRGDPTVESLLAFSRPRRSNREGRLALWRHMPAAGSPTFAIRPRIVSIVKAAASTVGTSSHSSGAETRASGVGRTE